LLRVMEEAASAPEPSPASMPRRASSRIACRIGDFGAARLEAAVREADRR
jgi:hypothetical protein